MKILFIGDIVGKPGRDAACGLVPLLRKEYGLDFVIANAENIAGGSGITGSTAKELFESKIDVLTSGDHIWKKKEIIEIINSDKRILRPLNFPPGAPGSGWEIFKLDNGTKIGVINLLGRVFMDPLECPFRQAMQAVENISKETPIIIVDVHAEATSEKMALGWYLDGRVSAVLGTHTHIQTADERLLLNGTAYITDVGMTGPYDSVIGRRIEDVLERFIGAVPVRFEVASDNIKLCGAIVEIEDKTGRAVSIKRIQRGFPQ
jgi:hypothetical protein